MSNPTLKLGDGNWAVKTSNLLGYAVGETSNKFVPRELTFTRNTTATYTDENGLIQTAAANIARVQDNSLLLEPQRTNSIRNSTMVGASTSPSTLPTNWVRQNTSGLTQSVVGVGTENGINYIDINLQGTATGANDAYSFDQTISGSVGQTWTNSWYFKLVSSAPNAVKLAIQEFNGGSFLNVVLQDITPTTTLTRYSQTKTLSDATVTNVRAMIYVNFVIGQTYNTTIRIAQPQMELGAYVTSIIPTLGTSVTRVADTCSKTGISDLIGQTEGTIFLDFVVSGVGANSINIYNNDRSANSISTNAVVFQPNGLIECQTFFGNGTFGRVTLLATGNSVGQRIKLGFRYKSGDFALYVNGVQKSTDTTTMTFIGTKNTIELDNNSVYYNYQEAVLYNQFVQFPTALTNTELAQLTTI